jgi:dienelactone hydrolase
MRTARPAPPARPGSNPGVVLVHGAYARGSSWPEVIERLRRAGLTATAAQNQLTSRADDVAHTPRILALHDGPVILAGDVEGADARQRARSSGVRHRASLRLPHHRETIRVRQSATPMSRIRT